MCLAMHGGNRNYDLWNASPILCQQLLHGQVGSHRGHAGIFFSLHGVDID